MFRFGRKKSAFGAVMFVILVAAALVLLRLVEQIGTDLDPDNRFTVVSVYDGDTFKLKGGDKLRLLAIDTPEKGDLFFQQAKARLEQLVLGNIVEIEYGVRRRDKYGRLLGFVRLDSLLVNELLISEGLAYLYLFKDNLNHPLIEVMLNAQRQAIDAGVGLWSIERTPEDYYISKIGSLRFHRPFCRIAGKLKEKNYQSFDSRTQAAYTGLSPCRTCKP